MVDGSTPLRSLDEALPGCQVRRFEPGDLAELVVLQRCCWVEEAIANDMLTIPALHETHDEVLQWATTWTTFVVRLRGRLVGAVRGIRDGATWEIGRLMVAPDLAGRGVGSALLRLIESAAPEDTDGFTLFTGAKSERNLRFYERAGYRLTAQPGTVSGHIPGAVFLRKPRPSHSPTSSPTST
jgi:GNAT superfamily N-acetyltransferase